MFRKILTATGAVAIAGTALISTGTAHASTTSSPSGPSVAIAPTRVELPPSPGRVVHQTFTVASGNTPVEITPEAVPFTQNQKGSPTVDTHIPVSESGIKWISVPRPFKLGANQQKKVQVAISEPHVGKHLPPGQKYIAVIWTAQAQGKAHNGSHVVMNGAVAGEMILDVPGIATHTTSFGLHAPFWNWSNSVPVKATARDTGNSYVNLHGPQQDIQAGSRKIPMNLLLLGGASHVQTVNASPGYGFKTISYNGHEARVLVLPGKLIVIVLAVLLLITGLTLLGRRSGKRAALRATHHEHV